MQPGRSRVVRQTEGIRKHVGATPFAQYRSTAPACERTQTGRTTHQQQARSYPQEHIQRATRAFGKVYAVKRFVQINFTH